MPNAATALEITLEFNYVLIISFTDRARDISS